MSRSSEIEGTLQQSLQPLLMSGSSFLPPASPLSSVNSLVPVGLTSVLQNVTKTPAVYCLA